MWYVLFEILSAKFEFLTQFNVTKYGKTGIGCIKQMSAIGSSMLKFIVVMHSCPTAYVMKHFHQALDFFKNASDLLEMHQIYLKCIRFVEMHQIDFVLKYNKSYVKHLNYSWKHDNSKADSTEKL